ncbi:TPA: HlyD family efflux transporter periplasmic adaptor subunit [Escherichia coli]|nr:membrane spanning export protein [Escherichia coli]CAD5645636.1 membrane spanning export protein [Escherichia coli]HAJ7243427.1 HlyD family efflux transporter periplasmic adaptor subunit [Escherichia coli]HBA7608957.1 HlyD family efflux transporter periplasmic adaptor subunit [Escherichia coli]HBA8089893.1 HlyD family efflux transporter periplasmic adaptor subunit [Escherichia coli]
MLTVTMIVLLYIIFSEIDIVSPGQGVITGGNDKVVIKSPSSGFINSFNLQEGDQIEKGMVLFSYTNLDYTYKGITLKDLIAFNNKKIKFLQQDSKLLESLLAAPSIPVNLDKEATSEFGTFSYYSFKEENDALQMEEQSLQEKENLLNEEVKLREKQITHLQRKDDLLRKGGASDIDVLTNTADIERQKTDLINVKINFLTLKNDISNAKSKFKIKLYEQIHSIRDKISDLERSNIENRGELELMNDKVSTNSVTSPFSGKVLKIENNLKEGSFIEQYQPVVTVKQDNIGRVIEAKFDTKYRPYLYEGADVKISVNSTAFKKNFTGKISKISADSFVANAQNNHEQRYYSVTIDTFEEIEPSFLPEGIEVNVFATSKKVSIFEYMIATLKSNIVFNVW